MPSRPESGPDVRTYFAEKRRLGRVGKYDPLHSIMLDKRYY